MTRDQRLALAALGMATIYCVTVYWFSPEQYGFYPPCPIYRLTGWLCPGCGSTRALHALLHGDFVAAAAFNPLVVLLLPFVFAAGAWQALSVVRSGRLAPLPLGSSAFPVALTVVAMFTVIRNLVHSSLT